MRFAAIVNAAGGTLRTIDVEQFTRYIETAFTEAGHDVEIVMASGKDVVEAVERVTTDPRLDGIIVAGGDGTLSLGAAAAWKHEKLLAVVPAGTMNFFAKSLELPTDIFAAVEALSTGEEKRVDIATANDKPFIHQFAAGIHPKMVRLRESLPFRSRIGKILASMRAALTVFRRAPRIKMEILCDGVPKKSGRFSLVAVSNNMYGAGHLPYSDRLDEGILGLYTLPPATFGTLIKLSFGLIRGHWLDDPDIDISSAREVSLKLLDSRRKTHVVMDGEIVLFDGEVVIRLHPKALRVLVPKRDTSENSSVFGELLSDR
jgi:diacylglycerol kinase family enzyme